LALRDIDGDAPDSGFLDGVNRNHGVVGVFIRRYFGIDNRSSIASCMGAIMQRSIVDWTMLIRGQLQEYRRRRTIYSP